MLMTSGTAPGSQRRLECWVSFVEGQLSFFLVCNSYLEVHADCGGADFMIVNWPSLFVHPLKNA